ncbi:MAG: hypothetical protein ACOX7N_06740 [Lawsonibacter sp.]
MAKKYLYYNSMPYDRSRKFCNFIGSTFALRRLSDQVCLEYDLSVIAAPKYHSTIKLHRHHPI